ncbi:MAG: phenylalanine--tRNA ligase subunit beta, partial [Candidatus Altiarchaeota archaeon]|nr:phenylalanine--tRNA ligase subunit beta [Candidatus Altiarchaeota archaeon]
MPSVEYSTCDLMGLLDWKAGIDELREKIPMMGVDLESIDDVKVSVEIFPNRPDMLSIEGFARSLKGFLGVNMGLVNYAVADSDVKLVVEDSVKDIRPAVTAALAEEVVLDNNTVKSVMDMQEKLHLTHGRNRAKVAIGVHDLDKVSPPFTYKAVKPKDISFVPLDMGKKMDLSQILRKHPKGLEFANLLEGKDKYPVFLDSIGEVLSFPPIINGELTKL